MAPRRRKENDTDDQNKSVSHYLQKKKKQVRKPRMKAISKPKRKPPTEVSQRRLRSHRNLSPARIPRTRRHHYNLRNGSSVVLVCEVPCCVSEEQRKKLARLSLDSALFCTSSTPAKRKQSHVSVITISSSDDCTILDRTAEWVANMDVDAPGNLGEEESIVLEDSCKSQTTHATSAEAIRTKMSLLHLPMSSESAPEPLCINPPEVNQNLQSQQNEQTSIEISHPNVPRSFLTNPSILFHDVNTHENNNSLSFFPNQQSEGRDMSALTLGTPHRFYFGHPQGTLVPRDTGMPLFGDLQLPTNRPNSQPRSWGNFAGTSSHIPNSSSSISSETQQRNEEARQRSLLQVPSTSQSPVFNPVLKITHKTSSNSDNS